jgi:hypothetical protein
VRMWAAHRGRCRSTRTSTRRRCPVGAGNSWPPAGCTSMCPVRRRHASTPSTHPAEEW